MIRKTFVIFAALACLFTAQAFALDTDYRPYMTIGGGVTLLEEKDLPGIDYTLSSDLGFNALIGYGLEYRAGRVEFTADYRLADLDEVEDGSGVITDLNGDISVAAFLMSIYYDFNRDGAISPYFGGGIGIANTRIEDNFLGDASDNAFAYQFGLGLTMNLSENTKLDLGYKLLGLAEPNLGQVDPNYFLFHNGNAAFRFVF